MDIDTGFEDSTRIIAKEVIKQTLIEKCGYDSRKIMIFGFGQGGMAALAATLDLHGTPDLPGSELGGVISIGGVLPASSSRISAAQKCKTPVLICSGVKSTAVTSSALNRIKNVFQFVEVTKWNRMGDGMPDNRNEMTPIMSFFSRRLKSTKGIPEGSLEI